MTTSSHRGSATIYQFPTRVRADVGARRDATKSNETLAAPNLALARMAQVACGGAWYHEEAVEAERAGKN
jgi:hypothetical protein